MLTVSCYIVIHSFGFIKYNEIIILWQKQKKKKVKNEVIICKVVHVALSFWHQGLDGLKLNQFHKMFPINYLRMYHLV